MLLVVQCLMVQSTISAQQCKGLVDAGPDMHTCDPSMMIQLQGVINGNPNSFEWTPATGLSSNKVLDPMVTIKTPGRYKFKLSAEVVGSTNLITNGNFEGGFSGFSTEYVFKTLGQGFGPDNVAIATNPQAYNSGFQNCGDHTSGGGNMWLVDGSPTAGKKVWCQTVAVIPGNSYQFEVWTMLVFPVSPSILEITVNGTPIGGGNVGGMCDWTQMMACFKATSGSATICISEVTGVSYGNDFALDDIALYDKCIDEDEVEVEIVDLIAKIIIPVKPKCSSEIFDLYATGSSSGPKITYEWTTDKGTILSQNGVNAKAKGTGTYTVTVKYDNGSVHCEKQASLDYDAPDKLDGLVQAIGIANCALDTVDLTVNMNTGSGIYTYDWGPANDILEGAGTESVKVNKAQSYKVTITDVTTGCKLELIKDVISDTVKPKFNLTGDSLIDCNHQTINLNSSLLDTNLYTLEWTLPNLQKINQSPMIKSNQSGTYSLKIQNKFNKCKESLDWLVQVDTTQPDISIGNNLIIDCLNNSVDIIANVKIKNQNNKYFWTLPSGQIITEDSVQTKTIQSGGRVLLRTINQKNGCIDLDSVDIIDSRKFPNLSIIKPDTLNCSRRTTDLTAFTSNQNNLSVNWRTTNGNIISGAGQLMAKSDKPGKYFITIEDTSNHCIIQDTIEVFENVIKPDAILGSDLVLKCSDSTIIIDGSLTQSRPNYLFSWSTPDGNIRSGQNTNSILADKSGTYILIVRDVSNSCSDTASLKVINDANKPQVTIDVPNKITCAVQQLSLMARANSSTGGSFTYNWNSDKGQIIQNSNQANPIITAPGIFKVIVTDFSNGCTSEAQVMVDIDTVSPKADAGFDTTLNCKIQNIILSGINSSSGPEYRYNWNTLNGQMGNSSDPKDIIALKPGLYNLTVLNIQNGCSKSDDVIVLTDTIRPTLNILKPDTLTCLINTVQLSSQGSSVGNNYVYQWMTSNGNILDPNNLPNVSVDKVGLYSLKIINTSNFCESVQNILVTEEKSLPTLVIDSSLSLTCKIKNITLNVSIQSNQNYLIDWNTINGSIVSGQRTNNPVITKEGWYTVNVTNRNGCSTVDSIFVLEIKNVPTGISLDLTQARCEGDNASVNKLDVSGGIGPYMYLIDGVEINNFPLNNINPGIHLVKAIDKNGCEVQSTFTMDQASAISVSLPPTLLIDEGNSGKLLLTCSIPLDSIQSIEWAPSEKLSCSDCLEPSTVNLTTDTTFTVSVTNKNGCIASASIRVHIIKRGIWVPNVFSPNGDQINDYFIPIVADGSAKEIKLMQIFDRWGELVFKREHFQINDENEGWNGMYKSQLLNPGVYIYQIVVQWNNGETFSLQGDITLIR